MGQIFIDFQMDNPLELTQMEKKDFTTVEQAFRRKMIQCSLTRWKRISLSLAYYNITCQIFNKTPDKLVTFIYSGDLSSIKQYISLNQNAIDQLIEEYPPIYYAARAGHYEIVQFFLQNECKKEFYGQKNTPMHCAAYYGHYRIILLLLKYGIDKEIKNQKQNLPIEEGATVEIKKLLEDTNQGEINELSRKIIEEGIGLPIINVFKNGEIKFKKIILDQYFQSYNDYVDAFHGTNFEVLFSIAKYGLRKPGEIVDGKEVKVVDGHICLNTSYQGNENWSKSIFLSPSIFYAANPVYSKEIIVDGKQTWLPLVQAKVRKGSYTKHNHTLMWYSRKKDEPVSLEFRIKSPEDQSNLMMRSENSDAVKVIALIFIKKGFLDKCPSDSYLEITKMMLDSPEEQLFRESIII